MSATIIGITGAAEHGKDAFANAIGTFHPRVVKLAFGDGVKDIAMMYGFTEQECYDQNFKNVINPNLGITFRQFAQAFATDCIRKKYDQSF
jgi:hypothetical protein